MPAEKRQERPEIRALMCVILSGFQRLFLVGRRCGAELLRAAWYSYIERFRLTLEGYGSPSRDDCRSDEG
jgi:hypothetical protein